MLTYQRENSPPIPSSATIARCGAIVTRAVHRVLVLPGVRPEQAGTPLVDERLKAIRLPAPASLFSGQATPPHPAKTLPAKLAARMGRCWRIVLSARGNGFVGNASSWNATL
jgi:hypothetical protein